MITTARSPRPRRKVKSSLVLLKAKGYRPQLEALEDRCLPVVDAVLQWNLVALDAVKNDYAVGGISDQFGPTHTSRALAIVHAAIYDAVNAVDGSYSPYLFTGRAQPGTSLEAAAAQAGHDTLAAMFPHQQPMFDAALASSLQGIGSGAANKGIKLGQEVAAQILAARQNDGSAVDPPYTPGSAPGQHRVDPLHPDQPFLSPGWGSVTPFCLTAGAQFRAPPPPALTSKEYVDAWNEVKDLGGDGIITPTKRTAEQTVIGFFWGYDAAPNLGTPPRLYNQIARVVAQQQGNTEVQNARLFALVNLAMADAGIATWETKYVYNFWRPILGIREADTDGNPKTKADPNWTYLGASADNGSGSNFTPPFPAYTSGHAGLGASVFRTLADFYGTDNVSFSFMSDEWNGVTKDQYGVTRPMVTRSFTRFSQAAEENGQSRIYLGIHWRFDKVQGIQLGNSVADYVFHHFLRPVNDLSSASLGGGSAPSSFSFGRGLVDTPPEAQSPVNAPSANGSSPAKPGPSAAGANAATPTTGSATAKSVDQLFGSADLGGLWSWEGIS